MGPDFLAQELRWFSPGARRRNGRALQARLDFENEWDDDLDERVAEITNDFFDADSFSELEDEELLENAESGEDDDD